MSENKKYNFEFNEKFAKEYWTVRIVTIYRDSLSDIADELNWNVGEALNRCVACGLKHRNEWAKSDKK